jgi:hypothetical protein
VTANKKEDEAMNNKILVPMKRNDRLEDFIPYVEKVALPGMKVIFMMPYPVGGLCWSTEEFGQKAIMDGKRLTSYYTWDTNLQKAKDQISAALRFLPARGIEVAVDLYAGSMRSAVQNCTARDGVHLIVTRGGVHNWIGKLIDSTMSMFRSLKRPSFSSVLLINPRTVV